MIKFNKITAELDNSTPQSATQPAITPVLARLVFGLGLVVLTISPVLCDPGSPWGK